MRSEIIVHKSPLIDPDRVDHQSIALVVADGFAEPGGLRMRGMILVQEDVTYLMILCPDHHHFPGSLHEIDRCRRQDRKSRDTDRPAALFGQIDLRTRKRALI